MQLQFSSKLKVNLTSAYINIEMSQTNINRLRKLTNTQCFLVIFKAMINQNTKSLKKLCLNFLFNNLNFFNFLY